MSETFHKLSLIFTTTLQGLKLKRAVQTDQFPQPPVTKATAVLICLTPKLGLFPLDQPMGQSQPSWLLFSYYLCVENGFYIFKQLKNNNNTKNL